MFRILLLTITFFCVAEALTNVKKCKNNKPFPLSVNVHGCTDPPCDVYKGSAAIMEVHFLGNRNNIKKMTTKVYATAFGVHLPYDLPDEVADVCNNLMYDAMCPIYKEEDVVYEFNFYVDPVFPEITVSVEVSLLDEQNETVACFICSCKVKKAINGIANANATVNAIELLELV